MVTSLITTKEKSSLELRVQSDMLYGSETWYLNNKEIAIFRETEKAMLRDMRGVKLMDNKKTLVN